MCSEKIELPIRWPLEPQTDAWYMLGMKIIV